MQATELQAGPEMDAEVARVGFGHIVTPDARGTLREVCPNRPEHPLCPRLGFPLRHYSTDRAAAMLILDHFWAWTINKCDGLVDRYAVTITARDGRGWVDYADELPLAICRAALKAKS